MLDVSLCAEELFCCRVCVFDAGRAARAALGVEAGVGVPLHEVDLWADGVVVVEAVEEFGTGPVSLAAGGLFDAPGAEPFDVVPVDDIGFEG